MSTTWMKEAPRIPFLIAASLALLALSWTDPSPALAAGCDDCLPGGETCTLIGCLVYVDAEDGSERVDKCDYWCSGSDGIGGDDGGSIWRSNPDGSGGSCIQGCGGGSGDEPIQVATDP